MARRVQVILGDNEVAQFRAQARRESKSLSAWFREAARERLNRARASSGRLADPHALETFFQACRDRESGREPDWDQHERLILHGAAEQQQR